MNVLTYQHGPKALDSFVAKPYLSQWFFIKV